ncbi:MAG TPA: helix-turn-helix domain-containing protein [Candidatus Thermoplasmatota archaeon]|nr:helix-turn-helix domain-containing protein [Candidatus Thermoplasmatota archaeon]
MRVFLGRDTVHLRRVGTVNFEELAPLLGLSSDEAHVYRHVMNRGPATASQVAKLLDKTRSRAYEILRRLVDQGLMVEQAGRPLQYIARPLHESLATKQAEHAALAERLASVHQSLKAPDPADDMEVMRKVTLFSGDQAIAREAQRLAAKPTTLLVLVGEPCFAEGPLSRSQMLAAIKSQAQSGVDVRVYLPETAAQGLLDEVQTALGRSSIQYHPSEFPKLAGVATDQCAFFLVPDSGQLEEGELLGIRVQSAVVGQFVCQAVTNLLHPIRSIPKQDGAESQFEAYIDALTHARSSVHLFLGAGWRDLRTQEEFAKIAELYWVLVKRGVRLRVLVDQDVMELMFLHSLRMTNAGEVRVTSWIPAWCCIVDERMLLQAIKAKDQSVLGRSSADPREVQFYLEVFDQLWHKARGLPAPEPVV